MRVLITTTELRTRSGEPLYARDVALELQREGHAPVLFTLRPGRVSDELVQAGIPVVDDLDRIGAEPDVIHGNCYALTLSAVQRLPRTPAVFVSHGTERPRNQAPLHPRVRRQLGVSQVCVDAIVDDGVARERAGLSLNFVDTERFRPRAPLPDKPRRALVFSNYAASHTHLPAVESACRRLGLALDVRGRGVGQPVERPEQILGEYDVVFAKARAAMEAMSVGCAVVLCDFAGVGPMVTSANFDALRPMNFGFQALVDELTAENVEISLARYDAGDAAAVRDLVRGRASLSGAVAGLVRLYGEVIEEQRGSAAPTTAPAAAFFRREQVFFRVQKAAVSLDARAKTMLRRVPGLVALWRWSLGRLQQWCYG